MSTRPRIPALVGAVCAAMLLAGCSSSGTVGSGSSATGGAKGGFAGGATGGTGGTTGGSTDASCSQAMLAIQNAEKAQNSTSPQAALQGVSTSIGQLRDGARAADRVRPCPHYAPAPTAPAATAPCGIRGR